MNLTLDGDVAGNSASADGGGVHLTGGADLTMVDASTFVGFSGQGNSANRGGGVFVEGGSAVCRHGQQRRLDPGQQGQLRRRRLPARGRIVVNSGRSVSLNDGGNGGGILATNDASIDLNARCRGSPGNTGALGAGIFPASPRHCWPTVARWSSGGHQPGDHRQQRVDQQRRRRVPRLHHGCPPQHRPPQRQPGRERWGDVRGPNANAQVVELSTCNAASAGFERYCQEFRGNSAQSGGAVYSSGGRFNAEQGRRSSATPRRSAPRRCRRSVRPTSTSMR